MPGIAVCVLLVATGIAARAAWLRGRYGALGE